MQEKKLSKILPIRSDAKKQSQEIHSGTITVAIVVIFISSIIIFAISMGTGQLIGSIASLFVLTSTFVLWQTRLRYPIATIRTLIGITLSVAIVTTIKGFGVHDVAILLFPIAIVLSSVLVSRQFYIAITLISMVALTLSGIINLDIGIKLQPLNIARGDIIIMNFILLTFSIFTWKMANTFSNLVKSLEIKEQSFNTLFDASHRAIIIYDITLDQIIDSNLTLHKMFHINQEEPLPKSPVTYCADQSKKSRTRLYRHSRRALHGKPQMFTCEVRRDKQHTFWVEVCLQKVFLQNQWYLMAELQDITQKKEIEEELVQNERLAAIGQLAGGIAHDFNNQLAGILGLSTLLIEKETDTQKKELIDAIITSAHKATELTKQVLSYARKGSRTYTTIDINSLIQEVYALLSRTIDKQITLNLNLFQELPTFIGDSSQLQNMLLNLGINARDALEGQGFITYTTRTTTLSQREAEELTIPTTKGEYIEVIVSDTGTGIPLAVQEHMFEPFYTTKPKGIGTGMGLSAILGAMLECKGGIKVESIENHGTDIHLYVPLTRKTPVHETTTIPLITDHHFITQTAANILIVDDEPVLRSTLTLMLKSLKHNPVAVEKGREALDLLTAHPAASFDLILLDMILADAHGSEIAQEIKKIAPQCPIIIVSGYSVGNELEETLDLSNVKGFLAKPFQKSDLEKLINITLA